MDAVTLARAVGCTRAIADRYVADMNTAMLAAGCTTVNRAAMWCAQVGHESLGLRYMQEIADGSAYEGRRDLGNTSPGDGRRYKGRGPIQLTGRLGYGQFLRWCREQGLAPPDFLADPAQVATSRWGFLAAAHYWTVRRPGLNAAADAGNVLLASRMVNGYVAKPNGLADRQRRWDACRELGDALLPTQQSSALTGPAGPAAPPPPPARRARREDIEMREYTDQPAPGAAKRDWPTRRLSYPFDPIGGWGGACVLQFNWGPSGGWLHLARWWIRDPNWTPNQPRHFSRDHPIGDGGSERFVGYDWVTAPPVGADSIELVFSAPDGLHVITTYEH